jgi:hypothetical protein
VAVADANVRLVAATAAVRSAAGAALRIQDEMDMMCSVGFQVRG